jgi:hypothetical protein
MQAEAERRSRRTSRAGSAATTDDGVGLLLALAHNDVIAHIAQFLGVRSLVRFGATSITHRIVAAREVERRKARIAEIENEVGLLMVSQKQLPNLSAYINRKFHLGDYTERHDPGDYTETLFITGYHGLNGEEVVDIKELYSRIETKNNGEVCVINPRREDFIAAKKLVYDAMRLIDDEIGVFRKALVCIDGTSYFDVWEEFDEDDDDEPGDKIGIFHHERRKFFSFLKKFRISNNRWIPQPRTTVGSLFILPYCFYFPPRGELSRMSSERIKRASRLARLAWDNVYGQFDDILFTKTIKMAEAGDVDAFRIAARELFFHGDKFKHMKTYLFNMISMADGHDPSRQGSVRLDYPQHLGLT